MLVSPTTPTTAFPIGERADDPMAMYLADLCTIPSNLAGNAALSVPCGLAPEDGLPVGLQIMAPVLADDRLLPGRRRGRGRAGLAARWAAAGRCPRPGHGRSRMSVRTAADMVPFDEAVARYEPVIGLETHVELGTVTKMFCGCPNRSAAEPNSQVCPVCLGLPGSLPVINRAAIEYTIRIGLALNCSIATWCRFARKNYFYPDMPKNFQISQYDEPLCTDGWLDVTCRRRTGSRPVRVGIERVHLEEDTGKSLHVGGATGRIHGADYSLVDYNRAGIPLVEIVTKPVPGTGALAPVVGPRLRHRAARPAARAGRLRRADGGGLAALRRQHLADAWAAAEWGTRTETKNVNSLRSVERAVRLRDRAAGRRARRGRPDRPGDPALPRGHRHHRRPGGARKRPRTTGTSPSPTWCRWPRRRTGSRRSRAPLPELPAARRARLQAEWGLSDLDMTALHNAGALDLVGRDRRGRRVARRRPQVVARRAGPARPTTSASSWPPCRSPRRRWPGSAPWSPRARSTTSWPGRWSTACWPARAPRTRSWPAAAWPSSATTARWPPPWTRPSRPTPTSPRRSATARSPRPARWSARS